MRESFDLGSIYLFEKFDKETLKELEPIVRKRSFKKEEVLFFEGDECENLYILISGIVKIYKVDAKGNEIVLHYIKTQNMIAEMAVLESIPYPASAICESDVVLLAIDSDIFRAKIESSPKFSLMMMRSLSLKIRALERAITQNMTLNAKQKVAKFLLEQSLELESLTQKKISEILNLTPETLSRILSNLKKEQLISLARGKIKIEDRAKLVDLL